jgi:uncharacterized protein (DUF1697 family)
MPQYLALLRGVNVGGNHVIKMSGLKSCFESMGFSAVATYIQSGNVVFRTNKGDAERMERVIEAGILETFRCTVPIVLVSHPQLKTIVQAAPRAFGSDPARYRYDVIFVKKPLTAISAIKQIPVKDGVDRVYGGSRVLYYSRLIAKATQSHLARVISLPMYQHMTIRNWNTITKLLALLDERILA